MTPSLNRDNSLTLSQRANMRKLRWLKETIKEVAEENTKRIHKMIQTNQAVIIGILKMKWQ